MRTRVQGTDTEREKTSIVHRGKQGLHTGPATKTRKATRAREEEGSTKNERASKREAAAAARDMRTRRRIWWRCPWNLPVPGTP